MQGSRKDRRQPAGRRRGRGRRAAEQVVRSAARPVLAGRRAAPGQGCGGVHKWDIWPLLNLSPLGISEELIAQYMAAGCRAGLVRIVASIGPKHAAAVASCN